MSARDNLARITSIVDRELSRLEGLGTLERDPDSAGDPCWDLKRLAEITVATLRDERDEVKAAQTHGVDYERMSAGELREAIRELSGAREFCEALLRERGT